MLLILAGVSISLVVGDNGVLTRAQGSSNKTKESQLKEAIDLAVEECQTEFFNDYASNASKTVDKYVTPEKVAAALANQGYYLYKSGHTGANYVTPNTTAGQDLASAGFGTTTFFISATKLTSGTDSVKDYVPFTVSVQSTGIGATVSSGELNANGV